VKQDIARQAELLRRQQRQMRRVLAAQLVAKLKSINAAAKLLSSLSHRSVLRRGFALVTAEKSLIGGVAAARPGMRVAIEFHDGDVGARIDKPDAQARPASPKKPSGAQGSLL
jgi:exodeoxyribonuclease VII large subunit